jgi:6,7-dimethyl-8-ribityllumazine synthase
VVRGETPHFDFIAGETTRGLGQVVLRSSIPLGFGLLTVDTMAQAQERAGGAFGNKGYEAAEAAIRSADLLAQMESDAPRP